MAAVENMTFDELKEKALLLPLLPGVYIMKDAQGTIIYIGKAKALKISTLAKLCQALDCQPGDILEYRGAQPDEETA